MFDLEKAVAEWRQKMRANGIKSPAPLDELETHLRDDLEQRLKAGQNEQLAFTEAVQGLGRPGALRHEFRKIDRTADILKRKTVWLLVGLGLAASWIAFHQSPQLGFAYGLLFVVLILAACLDFALLMIPDWISLSGIGLGLLCSFLVPQLHGQQSFTAGIIQGLLGAVLGAGLGYFILRAGKLAFGREKLALAPGTKVRFMNDTLVLPDAEIPYDELFYRTSDELTLQARQVAFRDHLYDNVTVRMTGRALHIGDQQFKPGEVSGLEAAGTEIVLPREVMGLGDVKLLAAIGGFLGWQAVIFSLMASSVLGSLVACASIRLRNVPWAQQLPFGPYLAMGAIIWIFCGQGLRTLFGL